MPIMWTERRRTDMEYIDGLEQERCNSSVLAMELSLSCINPSICSYSDQKLGTLTLAVSPEVIMNTPNLYTTTHD